jgi:hypothetical protein
MNDKTETKVSIDRDKSVTVKSPSSTSHVMMTDLDSDNGTASRLIVVDIGKKQGRKAIKRLRQGRGRLLPKIQAAVKEVQEETGQTNTLPIVFVVERRRRRGGFLF